jgi:hypothetical protein
MPIREVAQVAEEDRRLATLARRTPLAALLDQGGDLGREVATQPLAAELLGGDGADQRDGTAPEVDARRRGAAQQQYRGHHRPRIDAGEPLQADLADGGRRGSEDDPARVEPETGQDDEEQEASGREPRDAGRIRCSGEEASHDAEDGGDVEERDREAGHPRDAIGCARGREDDQRQRPVDGEEREVAEPVRAPQDDAQDNRLAEEQGDEREPQASEPTPVAQALGGERALERVVGGRTAHASMREISARTRATRIARRERGRERRRDEHEPAQRRDDGWHGADSSRRPRSRSIHPKLESLRLRAGLTLPERSL